MKKEFRKIIYTHAVKLHKEDVLEIIKILNECSNNEKVELEVCIGYGEETIPLKSVEEIRDFNSNEISNKLKIRSIIWSDNEIVSGVTLEFHYNFCEFQINSVYESWFLGKQKQLQSALKKFRPWYFWLKYINPIIFGSTILLSGKFALNAFQLNNYNETIIGLFLLLLTILIAFLDLKQKIFPYVQVVFNSKNPTTNIISKENFILLIELTTLIITIYGLITQN